MIHLRLHSDAVADLDRVRTIDAKAWAALGVFMQEARALGAQVASVLTTTGNVSVGGGTVNVQEWATAQKVQGRPNLWRLRLIETAATSYRLIAGYHYPSRQYVVLAVVRKIASNEFADGFDYDDLTSPIAQRVIAAWKSLE